MASSNIDYSDYKRIAPPYDEPPRQRGCFFYGCIIATVLSLLLLIAIAVIFFVLYRWLGNVVEEYTATAPRELPKVEMPAEQRATLKQRVDAFQSAIKEGRPTEPLVLTSEEVNALIEDHPDLKNLKGKVYVTIEQDKLKGQVSVPLSDVPLLGLTRGRYLNGEAEIKVSLQEGILLVTLDSIEVNGKKVPEEAMKSLRNQNWAQDVYKDPRKAEELRKYQSIEIKDGKLIIKVRDTTKADEGGQSEGSPRIETRDGKVIVHPPHEKAAPSNKAEAPPPWLPDDVLAPPDPRPAAPAESARKP
jgi:hypothetical protein